jgi:hypothetical protein
MKVSFSSRENTQWENLRRCLKDKFKQDLKLEGMLFLIGIQEIGGKVRRFSKEEKMDLMHVGLCAVLELGGYYKKAYIDQDGWPHWDLVVPIENADLLSQTNFLRYYILQYFLKIFSAELE